MNESQLIELKQQLHSFVERDFELGDISLAPIDANHVCATFAKSKEEVELVVFLAREKGEFVFPFYSAVPPAPQVIPLNATNLYSMLLHQAVDQIRLLQSASTTEDE